MTEKELYAHVVELREKTDALIGYVLDRPATIELCLFTGKLGAVLDVLMSLEAAGVPMSDPNEPSHPLARGGAGDAATAEMDAVADEEDG